MDEMNILSSFQEYKREFSLKELARFHYKNIQQN